MLAKNPQSWLAHRVTSKGGGASKRGRHSRACPMYVLVHSLSRKWCTGTGAIARSLVGRRARCSARAREGPLQALERCVRALLREWASFSARALRTKLCMRTSFRTQNSLSRRAMRRGIRVASCTSSSSC